MGTSRTTSWIRKPSRLPRATYRAGAPDTAPVRSRRPRKSTPPAGVSRSASTSRSSSRPRSRAVPRTCPARRPTAGYCTATVRITTGSASIRTSTRGTESSSLIVPSTATTDSGPSATCRTVPCTASPVSRSPSNVTFPRTAPRSASAGTWFATSPSSSLRISASSPPARKPSPRPAIPDQRTSARITPSRVRRTSPSERRSARGPSPLNVPVSRPRTGSSRPAMRSTRDSSSGDASMSTSTRRHGVPVIRPNEPSRSVAPVRTRAFRAWSSTSPDVRVRMRKSRSPRPVSGSTGRSQRRSANARSAPTKWMS